MKYWIRLLALVSCIILIFAVIGSLLPHGYSFSATKQIDATPHEVYEQIDSLPDWKSWSQWNPDTIKDLKVDYAADGKSQRWTDVRGDGKLWITNQEPDRCVNYQMRFANFPEMTCSILLEAKDGGTFVTWQSDGVLPSGPFYGYFRHIYVNEMTNLYDQSLQRLKGVVEEEESQPDESQSGGQ